ncbi:MAG: cupin domain-containing protein [Halanaerobiales bacterium]
MKIIKMREIEGNTNKRGVTSRPILKNEEVKVTNLVLNPKDEVPVHSVPVHVFFYIVSGKGTIQIGEESAVVEENDIIPCPVNTEMALYADQGKKFEVLNVKTPSL